MQFTGKRVSRRWHRVLNAARDAGVRFTLNSGRRTLAEQTRLWRNPPRDAQGRPVPVAFPTPNAPHIWLGRQAHAIDVDALDGGETRLQRWLEAQGVRVTNPVASEAWHQVVSDADLRRLASRIHRQWERERKARRERQRKIDVARKHGAHFVDIIADVTERLDMPLALGLALIEQESGFRNVYGHDPTIFGGAGEVTRGNYAKYLKQRGPKGRGGMQGVGPAQLTWYSFQDEADRRGGAWNPEHNIAVGLEHLAVLIKAHGERDGIALYNGTGPAAERYAQQVAAKRALWAKRLAGGRTR